MSRGTKIRSRKKRVPLRQIQVERDWALRQPRPRMRRGREELATQRQLWICPSPVMLRLVEDLCQDCSFEVEVEDNIRISALGVCILLFSVHSGIPRPCCGEQRAEIWNTGEA